MKIYPKQIKKDLLKTIILSVILIVIGKIEEIEQKFLSLEDELDDELKDLVNITLKDIVTFKVDLEILKKELIASRDKKSELQKKVDTHG